MHELTVWKPRTVQPFLVAVLDFAVLICRRFDHTRKKPSLRDCIYVIFASCCRVRTVGTRQFSLQSSVLSFRRLDDIQASMSVMQAVNLTDCSTILLTMEVELGVVGTRMDIDAALRDSGSRDPFVNIISLLMSCADWYRGVLVDEW